MRAFILSILLFVSLSASASDRRRMMMLQKPVSGGGGSSFLDPTNLVGNFQLQLPEYQGSQSDGYAITLNPRSTNHPTATASSMYSYGTILLSNNVLNGFPGYWCGGVAAANLENETPLSFSNFTMVTTVRIDGRTETDVKLVDFTPKFYIGTDPTRTNWISIFYGGVYLATNQFTIGVPFTLAVHLQGTNLSVWREYGQVGSTYAVTNGITTVSTYGVFGNSQTQTQKPLGYQFDFLMNTNGLQPLTNATSVAQFHTNRYGVH